MDLIGSPDETNTLQDGFIAHEVSSNLFQKPITRRKGCSRNYLLRSAGKKNLDLN